jgi:hypothetical protein
MVVEISNIKIPQNFVKTPPRQSNFNKHYKYFKKNKRFKGKVIVNQWNQLKDGYITYLIALQENIKELTCEKSYDIRFNKKETRQKLLEKSNNRCSICGCYIQNINEYDVATYMTIDHIIPKSKGGAIYDINNMQATCIACNGKKADKVLVNRKAMWGNYHSKKPKYNKER